MYEKNNLNLADCGKHLLQIGIYEVPSVKSTLQSFEKQIKDFQNKEQAINEEIIKKQRAYKEKCNIYCIEGSNLHYELMCTTRKIPEIYNEIILNLKSCEFNRLLDCYRNVSFQNHKCQIDLPTIWHLQQFSAEVDIEKIKNK